VPSFVAFAVVGLLEQHFARLVDYGFTASVEGDLDDIATGERRGVDWLTRFYFGSESGVEGGIAKAGGLKKLVSERLGDIDARGVNSIPLSATYEGKPVVVRVGRYGPYLQADGDEGERASLPDDIAPDELTQERVAELLSAPSSDRSLGPDPETGHTIMVKAGRYGPYVSMVLPEGSDEKPPTASLFASMTPETLTLEQARQLLTLPRAVGELDGEKVEARNGRYGPYLSKGTDSRSLDAEEKLFTVSLDEAKALFAQPKRRGRRGAAAPPLKELGADPGTGKPMVVKDGRFGPYVTDGETNASLRKGDDVETLTDARAIELLAERRARGPAPKRAAKKAAAKKTTAKKATAKKATAKKAAAKSAS